MKFTKQGEVRIEQLRDEIRRRVVEFPAMAIQWDEVDAIEIEDVNGLATKNTAAIQTVIDEHVPSMRYFAGELKELETIIANQQKIELLSLPNWATWTATQAKDAVSSQITGGMTLEQCNKAIDEADTIAKFRPILKNIVRAIYAIEGVLSAMARAIIYIRDILKP